jgi:hypothetical protein
MPKNHTRTMVIVAVVAALAVAFVGYLDMSSRGTPTATPATLTTSSTALVNDTGFYERTLALGKRPLSECKATNAYEFIGPPGPPVLATGAIFTFVCEKGFSGWFHSGARGDAWTPKQLTSLSIPADQFAAELPIEAINPPRTKHHPAHPDALTLADLHPGTPICSHAIPGDRRDNFVVSTLVTIAHRDAGGKPTGYPALGVISPDGSYKSDGISLEALGVIPYTFGQWSASFVTPGPCKQ